MSDCRIVRIVTEQDGMERIERLNRFTRKHLARLSKHLEGVLERGDVDAIHDFRVASRRLQEPLQVMALNVSPQRCKRVQRRLKRLRKSLSLVRDLDVLQESLGEGPTGPGLGTADRSLLDEMLLKARRQALTEASQALVAGKPEKVPCKLGELIAALDELAPEKDEQVYGDAVAMWRRRAEALLAERPTTGVETDLHACRILLKKLRYSTELLRLMQGRERGEFVAAIVAMQDRLGAWNDHLFATAELSRIATQHDVIARSAEFTAAVLTCAAARARLAHAMRRDAVEAWPSFRATVEKELAKGAESINEPKQPPAGTQMRA
ncbi:MAG: CHAD domain-containing protein [Phycisphaerales bacterium]|nr:CHAD domain-containing protein [Phycisphaerales bacterium]